MSDLKLYQTVWNKFLPLVSMKLKAAVKKAEIQSIGMDKIDFEKASHRKNCKYQFSLEINEGLVVSRKTTSAIALDFARALSENEITKELIKSGNYKFNLNSKFILSIEAKAIEVKVAEAEQ